MMHFAYILGLAALAFAATVKRSPNIQVIDQCNLDLELVFRDTRRSGR